MRAPEKERRPVASGAASEKIMPGGRSEDHSTGGHPQSTFCHTDDLGVPDAACWSMALDQHRRGYVAGYADGLRRAEHATMESLRRAIADVKNGVAI